MNFVKGKLYKDEEFNSYYLFLKEKYFFENNGEKRYCFLNEHGNITSFVFPENFLYEI